MSKIPKYIETRGRQKPIAGWANRSRSTLRRVVPREVGMGEYGPVDSEGLGGWTSIFTSPLETIGLRSPNDIVPVHYNAWRSAVLARGNTPARFPSGPSVGKWAERYLDRGEATGGVRTYRYANAPQTVWDEDTAMSAITQRQIAAGQAATTATDVLEAIRPPNLVQSLTGIPSWMFPLMLVGGGLMYLTLFIPKARR